MRRITRAVVLAIGALVALNLTDAAHAQKKTLVVALNQDPDILDPTLSRTYVGRIVFSQMCEKLYEIDESLRISPAARRRASGDQRRRQDRHHQAPPRREVQRRHADERRGREALARPAPRR